MIGIFFLIRLLEIRRTGIASLQRFFAQLDLVVLIDRKDLDLNSLSELHHVSDTPDPMMGNF